MAEQAEVSKKSKTEYFPVVMEDGTTYEFAGKRKMEKEPIVERDAAGNPTKIGVKFRFRHGGVLMSWVPDHLIAYAAAHGWGQKLGDSVAGLRDEKTKEPADSEDLQIGVEELNSDLQKPAAPWNSVREGGGFGGASILAKALVLYTAATDRPQTPEQVKAFLQSKDATAKMALRDKPSRPNKEGKTLQDIIATLEKEKKSKVNLVDVDKEMEELMGSA